MTFIGKLNRTKVQSSSIQSQNEAPDVRPLQKYLLNPPIKLALAPYPTRGMALQQAPIVLLLAKAGIGNTQLHGQQPPNGRGAKNYTTQPLEEARTGTRHGCFRRRPPRHRYLLAGGSASLLARIASILTP